LEAMVFAYRCYIASLNPSDPSTGSGGTLAVSQDQPFGAATHHAGSSKSENSADGKSFLWGVGGLIPDWNATGTSEPKEMILITQSLKELQQVMSDYVGIVRNDIRLQRAMSRLDLLWEETEQLYEATSLSLPLLELRNMISVGYLIVKGAAFRKESRGLHFNTDYPNKSELVQNIVL